jgi:transcriptional regulator with XRE-family HTH domain
MSETQLGTYVKARREASGLTQRALAELIGITPQRLCIVEQNAAKLTAEQCTAAARVLDADVMEMLAKAGHVSPLVYRAICASPKFWGPLVMALESEPSDIDGWIPLTSLAMKHGIFPENTRRVLGLLARLRRAVDES